MVKYLLVSLNDEKTKSLAEVLGNNTCKKIIELLADQELSETDISKKLKIPINTAEYNIRKLVKSGLIEEKKEYFWSVKGKKIPIYQLSNKDILISSKKTKYDALKKFVPVVLISGLGALLVKYISDSLVFAEKAVPAALSAGQRVAEEPVGASIYFNIFELNPAIWFFAGALFALIILLITDYIIKKTDERR